MYIDLIPSTRRETVKNDLKYVTTPYLPSVGLRVFIKFQISDLNFIQCFLLTAVNKIASMRQHIFYFDNPLLLS
jgi:hypothetical protein